MCVCRLLPERFGLPLIVMELTSMDGWVPDYYVVLTNGT